MTADAELLYATAILILKLSLPKNKVKRKEKYEEIKEKQIQVSVTKKEILQKGQVPNNRSKAGISSTKQK